jgi:hypothetical protein
MIVTQTGTVTGALTGIETGIGEIAIAAIGTVTDSGIKTATFGIPVRSFEVKYQT